MLRVIIDLFAQPSDIDIHQIGLWIKVIPPHMLQQLGPRIHAPRRTHQQFQQTELACRQLDFRCPLEHLVAQEIHLQLADHQVARERILAAARNRMEPGNQLLDIKGFCQIIIRADIQTVNALIQPRTGCHKNHRRRIALLAHPAQNTESITARQHDVQDNGIVGARLNKVLRIGSIRAQFDIKALLA